MLHFKIFKFNKILLHHIYIYVNFMTLLIFFIFIRFKNENWGYVGFLLQLTSVKCYRYYYALSENHFNKYSMLLQFFALCQSFHFLQGYYCKLKRVFLNSNSTNIKKSSFTNKAYNNKTAITQYKPISVFIILRIRASFNMHVLQDQGQDKREGNSFKKIISI